MWKPVIWIVTALFGVAVANAANDAIGNAVADLDKADKEHIAPYPPCSVASGMNCTK